MTTMASDIADYLESLGLGTKGTDIHQSEEKDEPHDAVLLTEGGGLGADRSHDMRRILNPGLLIIVRAAHQNFNAGYERAHNIYDAMLDLANTAIAGNRYLGVNPLGDVTEIGRDEQDRWKWSMNFVVKRT